MDVVYVFKKRPELLGNDELLYSIRSLSNLLKCDFNEEKDRLWIVGDKPNYINSKVRYIQMSDPYRDKQSNVIRKLLKICDNPDLSEDFILMNDDFFFINAKKIITYSWGKIKNIKSEKRGRYLHALDNCETHLTRLGLDNVNYEVHYPMIFNKHKLKEVLSMVEWEDYPTVYRSLYGNFYKVYHVPVDYDFKVYDVDEFMKLRWDEDPFFISTDNNVIRSVPVNDWLEKTFREKSVWEK
jgi:hypothetical protein